MVKSRSVWFWFIAIAAFLLSANLVWAAQPQDCSVVYSFKNPDGSVFRTIKYCLRDGSKFRAEYIADGATPHTVNILRKDKGLVWSLDPATKKYREVALDQDKWNFALTSVFAPDEYKDKKIGQATILKHACDVYEVGEDWVTTCYIAQGLNIFLKFENRQNKQLVQIQEATELRLEKPAAALFEIPAGYVKEKP